MSYSGKTSSSVPSRVAHIRFRNKASQRNRTDAERRANVWKKILDDVCDQCSLHGLNHIVGKDRSAGEKSVLRLHKRILFKLYHHSDNYIYSLTY